MEQIVRLQDKVQQLVKQYQLLQKENLHLRRELVEEKSKQQAMLTQTEQLSMQVDILKAAKAAEMSEEDKKLLEKRLSLYVKEIDKCIALLKD